MRFLPFLLLGCVMATVVPIASVSAQPVTTVADLPTIGSGMGGGEGPFTLYSLRDERIVPQKDSASTDWDIGFRGTTIIVNGGTSGPGEGAAALLSTVFEEVAEPPAGSLFRNDGDGDCPNESMYAICTGSLNGWYEYAGSGVVNPLPETTLVFRLADGGFAKVRILKYEMAGESRRYTFEYAVF